MSTEAASHDAQSAFQLLRTVGNLPRAAALIKRESFDTACRLLGC